MENEEKLFVNKVPNVSYEYETCFLIQKQCKNSARYCPSYPLVDCRAAKLAGIGELESLIANDLIDSEDSKNTLFCHEIAFPLSTVLRT